jgi:hypothetical protein
MSVGSVPQDKLLKSIDLFATKVAPAVREELGAKKEAELQ